MRSRACEREEATRVLRHACGELREGFHAEGGTDFEAIDEGFVSVTPMRSDLTNHRAIELLKKP